MRMLMRVTFDTPAGNAAVREGTIETLVGDLVERHKPEAAYFYAEGGKRTGAFVLNMADSSEIPPVAEPFFTKLNASVHFTPVMNLEDLKKGLGALAA